MTDAGGGRVVTFYSARGGTGRSMALANTAWILASNGLKVLAADWDLESPSLHRYFRPFLDDAAVERTQGISELVSDYAAAAVDGRKRAGEWHRDYASVLRHAMSLSADPLLPGGQQDVLSASRKPFPGGGTLDFLSAGRELLNFTPEDWDNFFNRLGGGLFIEALCADMRQSYDYVLVDSRTGTSDVPAICTMLIPDAVVVCFTLSDEGIEGAVTAARAIGNDEDDASGHRAIRVLPVPTRVDHAEPARIEVGRALVDTRFDGIPAGLDPGQRAEYWRSVEIPYKPAYAFEESLAVFCDEPGSPASLLAAFERLTSVITNGQVAALSAIGEAARRRYRETGARRSQ
jgi:MinD-like ATPase involved in chromosome partitioning or flagellar assembly